MWIARSTRIAVAVLSAVAVLVSSSPAAAEKDPTTVTDVSLGLASGLCTLGYTPLKLVWAITGSGVAGLVYLFSAGNTDVATTVLRLSGGGDYVVTPDHLKGVQVLRIIGN
jgi:hypothetical protein